MTIIRKQRLSLPCSSGPRFGSLPQSARYPDLRPLANLSAAARARSHPINSPFHNGSSRPHFQSRGPILLYDFGSQRITLYNPHRTR